MRHHVSLRKYWQNRIPPRKLNLTFYFKITSIFYDRYPTVNIKQSRCVVVGGEGGLTLQSQLSEGNRFLEIRTVFRTEKNVSHYFQFYYHKQFKKKIILIILPLIKYCACQVINASRSICFYHSVMTGGKASQ